MRMSLLFWLFLLLGAKADQQEDSRVTLHILNILPFPEMNRIDSGWDKAYELIPAADLAMDQINNDTDILPGYKLKLIHVKSEACGISLITKGVVNIFAEMFDPSHQRNVVGLAGLYCSTVTDVIAKDFSKEVVTYLQLAGSTSPVHRNESNMNFHWLVHLISSSAFNNAFTALTRKFDWKRVGIVYDALSVFHRENAANLMKYFTEEERDVNVTADIPITRNTDHERVFKIVSDSKTRILYISALDFEGTNILCEAYHQKAFYPGYVYIFPTRSRRGLLSRANKTRCEPFQIEKALEGAIFLQYKLTNQNKAMLESNLTYTEYRQKYLQYLTLTEMDPEVKALDRMNGYANIMYDQIWAFALALGRSLGDLHATNISLDPLKLEQTRTFASIVRGKLSNISFEGASGRVKFKRNNVESTVVKITQVINGTEKLLAVYNHNPENKSISQTLPTQPSDRFDIKPLLLPPWEFYLFNVLFIVFIAVTTFVFIFLLVFRDRPEVKASSPFISFVMISGCYLTVISALVRNICWGHPITNFEVFTLLCNVQMWLWMIGLTLLFSALMLRLLRVYNIFKAYGRTSHYWKDKYMILYIFLVCCGEVVILVIWTAVDRIQMIGHTEYQPDANPPYFQTITTCSCNMFGVWLALTFSYNGLLMLIIVLLAVKTRKIRLSNFKNTKQINAFIILTCMTLGFLIPLWYVIGIETFSELNHLIVCFAFSSTGVYCQLLIFLPQVFVTMQNKFVRGNIRRRESQFSQVHQPLSLT
jgi:gamma-aminobutyric acid type B receptor